MMAPPKSGRKAVRLRAAASIDELGHVYTMLMSAWIIEEDSGKEVPFTSWIKPFRRRLVAVTAQLHAGKQHMMLATWEGNVRGRWPKEEYFKLTEVQEEMIAVLAQVRDVEQVYSRMTR
jgi:Aromatic acid exporter family member 2